MLCKFIVTETITPENEKNNKKVVDKRVNAIGLGRREMTRPFRNRKWRYAIKKNKTNTSGVFRRASVRARGRESGHRREGQRNADRARVRAEETPERLK